MLRLKIQGENMKGEEYTKALMLRVGTALSGADRLTEIGFDIRTEDQKVLVDNVVFGSKAVKMGVDFDQEILSVEMPAKRPPKQLMFFPALVLLALVYWLQKRRKTLPAN